MQTHEGECVAYSVPKTKTVIAQQTTMGCWATVYAMMRSWRDQKSYAPATAVALVDQKYRTIFDDNTGLPPSEFGPFIAAAGMSVEPMQNRTIAAWEKMLRTYGLLWVGTLSSTHAGAGLHSRIIEAIVGDGTVPHTKFSIIDPDGGRRYSESLTIFIRKYEGAIKSVGNAEYFQIRHY